MPCPASWRATREPPRDVGLDARRAGAGPASGPARRQPGAEEAPLVEHLDAHRRRAPRPPSRRRPVVRPVRGAGRRSARAAVVQRRPRGTGRPSRTCRRARRGGCALRAEPVEDGADIAEPDGHDAVGARRRAPRASPKANATTRQPGPPRFAAPCGRAGRRRRRPAPGRAPSLHAAILSAAASRVRPALADHPLDLQRHGSDRRSSCSASSTAPGPLRLADGAEEVEDLELEGVVLVDEEVLDEGRLPVADGLAVERVLLGGPPVDLDVLVGVVEEDVGVGLGDGERADLLLGGPAGRDGGDGPGIEEDLHVGDVGTAPSGPRAPGRRDPPRLAVHEAQHDVDVVDHQVHDDRVVLHPRHEGPEPPRLDQDRALDDLAQLLHGAVEALDVADVEDDVPLGARSGRARGPPPASGSSASRPAR